MLKVTSQYLLLYTLVITKADVTFRIIIGSQMGIGVWYVGMSQCGEEPPLFKSPQKCLTWKFSPRYSVSNCRLPCLVLDIYGVIRAKQRFLLQLYAWFLDRGLYSTYQKFAIIVRRPCQIIKQSNNFVVIIIVRYTAFKFLKKKGQSRYRCDAQWTTPLHMHSYISVVKTIQQIKSN